MSHNVTQLTTETHYFDLLRSPVFLLWAMTDEYMTLIDPVWVKPIHFHYILTLAFVKPFFFPSLKHSLPIQNNNYERIFFSKASHCSFVWSTSNSCTNSQAVDSWQTVPTTTSGKLSHDFASRRQQITYYHWERSRGGLSPYTPSVTPCLLSGFRIEV